jgi:hypothetical protein
LNARFESGVLALTCADEGVMKLIFVQPSDENYLALVSWAHDGGMVSTGYSQ